MDEIIKLIGGIILALSISVKLFYDIYSILNKPKPNNYKLNIIIDLMLLTVSVFIIIFEIHIMFLKGVIG